MNITEYTLEDMDFYPTPTTLIDKMLEGLDWKYIFDVLEPSCGKGDIVARILETTQPRTHWDKVDYNIDMIEKDPNLRAICKARFENEEYNYCEGKRIIYDDFLKFNTLKQYDLIIMNPPFSNGDEHLLKALEMQKDGGSIICLLNAETIRNPYTNRRKALLQTLNEVSAQIEFLSDEFSHAERKTDVEIALIKIVIPRKEHKSDIYEHFQKAEEYKEERIDVTDVAVSDYLENIICLFNIECKAGIELIRQYNALQPYIKVSFNKDYNYGSLLALTTTKNKEAANVNSYLKDVRYKYWSELLTNEKFVGKLTSNLRKEYYNMVSNLKNYDFNAFNIGVILDDIQKNVNRGIEETIMGLFDKLTAQHSWYPECAKNIHLFNGWKTNKAHMINKKVILPTYGNFSSYSWDKDKFQLNNVYDTMIDIEKVLNYLDSDRTESIDMLTALKVANESGQTRNIRLKYFDIDLYKKGTTHIKFRDMELLKKFNIFAAQNRNWLPPNYGKVKYEDMTEEEKAVIDDFQGQKDYEETLRQSNFYLGVEKLLMIE